MSIYSVKAMPHVICFLMHSSIKCLFLDSLHPINTHTHTHTHTHIYRCPNIQERYFKIGRLLSALQIELYVWLLSNHMACIGSPFSSIARKFIPDSSGSFLLLNEIIEKFVCTNGNIPSFS